MDLSRHLWGRQICDFVGGLHIEMALWSTMGDLLHGSRWPEVLTEAGLVKTEAAAAAFLTAFNVMR